jgi:hypothetical protein
MNPVRLQNLSGLAGAGSTEPALPSRLFRALPLFTTTMPPNAVLSIGLRAGADFVGRGSLDIYPASA